MHLLRPYPDELVGSVLHRASRQLGLSQKLLLPLLTRRKMASHSMVMTSHMGIATACGMGLNELLERHTLLPYTTAFIPRRERDRILTAFTGERTKEFCAAAISQNSTKSTNWLKLCVECVLEDLLRYGESYWRRAHQLTGVELCLVHASRLDISTIEIYRTASVPPPHEVRSFKAQDKSLLPFDVQLKIARTSVSALHGLQAESEDWTSIYQSRARELGFAFKSGDICGEVLAQDMQTFYGNTYLICIDCSIDLDKKENWPSRMLRTSGRNATVFKHVLLNVFFDSSPTPSLRPVDFVARKKAKLKDWPSIERAAIAQMDRVISRHETAGTKVMLKDLFEAARIKVVMKRHRREVPGLVSWVESFKATSPSERQIGKKPRAHKKSYLKPSK